MQRPVTLLLTAAQMQKVDAAAVSQGINSFTLMCSAGKAVSQATVQMIQSLISDRSIKHTPDHSTSQHDAELLKIVVLAGPGNNGGDGAIAATELRELGYEVRLVRFATRRLRDEPSIGTMGNGKRGDFPLDNEKRDSKDFTLTDATRAFALWKGPLEECLLNAPGLDQTLLRDINDADVIIDALFGAGLSRPLTGNMATLVDCINESSAKVISIDVPSGLDGNTHQVAGACVRADITITFFCYKPVHFLYPGADLCGHKKLAQIGLSNAQLNSDWPECLLNDPGWFLRYLTVPSIKGHKFDRGHVLVRSGPVTSTGAARLSAQTALECGAGLVTLSSDRAALSVNAAHLTAVMLKPCDSAVEWQALLQDSRINTVVVGPGNGVNADTRMAVEAALEAHKHCILDADALSCWISESQRQHLFELLSHCACTAVLTPHAGEFSRLFPTLHDQSDSSKLHMSLAAARLASAVVVLKGADTVIASPDGRSAINASAPPWLATAGAGDVLAGAIASLVAQGMPSFEAACASVWMHGEAAMQLGYPMTAEKLVKEVPCVLGHLCTTRR
ncbi:MAG: NAD(P)H-hydrate dehydratase [Granulosicoccus sp.]